MRKTWLIVVLLMAAAAFAATPDSNASNATAPGIRTYLMPDLTFKSVFSPDLLGSTAGLVSEPEGLAAAPAKLGFCQCGCGIRCTTSADCGGSACRPFITCCAHKTQTPEADWFTRSLELSSHKTSQSEAILEQMAKSGCK